MVYITDFFGYTSAEIQGDLLTVDFSEQRNWTGVVSEMEHVTDAGSGNLPYSSNKNMLKISRTSNC